MPSDARQKEKLFRRSQSNSFGTPGFCTETMRAWIREAQLSEGA